MQRYAIWATLSLSAVATGCNQDPAAATGGAATETCQRVFISGMEPSAYERDVLPVVSLALLGTGARPSVDVDYDARTVTATLTYNDKTFERTAAYRDGIGCTPLIGIDAQTLRAQPFSHHAPTQDAAAYWPTGGAGPRPDTISADTAGAIDTILRDRLFPGTGVNTYSVALAKDGELLYERYRSEGDPNSNIAADTPLLAYSMSKTVTALGLGVLHDDGAFALDTAVPVPEWETDPRGTSYRHLLNMESGLAWKEAGDALARADSPRMVFTSASWAGYAAGKAQAVPPGQRWRYSTGDTMLLARELQRLLGATDIDRLQAGYDFFTERVFAPAGITTAGFQADTKGTFGGGSFFFMTTRDWLRVGQLILDGGHGPGGQVVSSGWLDFMRTPSPACAVADGDDCNYGGHVWLRRLEVDGESLEVVYLSGFLGNLVAIVPDRGVVLARLGATAPNRNVSGAFFDALAEVLQALE